ncbi:HAD superfamily hydrolase (TIGR01490 family) [Friedmanniella endophytica]|uniref:HAD superfamily hydrolase (TIGR01490 family) n=1 Tax=Microlunatus kandeliicorticis TaxID=1759536 RepID=A0A7W3IRU2_9ACTN|nr:HAD family hydrolase [Microlunatus kandeliicorticis]MBA8793998.1 HAD superfamily hydrolase (TIGR01490 family) [Microlunatus kandeliicorticis]
MPAAFFDLDKTILSRSVVLAFARPLYVARLITRRDVARSALAQAALVRGRVDHAAMERMRAALSALVAGWDADHLRSIVGEQLAEVVTPLVFDEARTLIRAHQDAGDTVVVVTSTGLDLAEPVGALLGVDEVLGTRMVEVDGHYTGEIADYMYGPRKAEAIRAWALEHGHDLAACAAYTDSVTDLPMLREVGSPHAVNPDAALRRIAVAEGWPVHDFGPRGSVASVSARRLLPAVAAVLAACVLVGLAARRRRS